MGDAVARASQIIEEIPGALMLDQFSNPANPEVHRRTTAMEIWEDAQGRVDVFVAGVGTGGTITGVGEILKERKPDVRIVAVESDGAALLSGGPAGAHQIPGIGVGFIPKVLNRDVLDEVIAVSDENAFACARRLAREEGIVAGASSGAALHAALKIAAREDSNGKMIVVVLADTGERYITSSLFRTLGLSAGLSTHRGQPDPCRHIRIVKYQQLPVDIVGFGGKQPKNETSGVLGRPE
jgi:cysteine synthase